MPHSTRQGSLGSLEREARGATMDYPTHHPLRRLRRWTAGILAGAGVGTLAVTAVLAAEQANGEIDQGGTSQWTSEDREGAEHNDDDGGTSFGRPFKAASGTPKFLATTLRGR